MTTLVVCIFIGFIDMSAGIFDKILKIINIVVTILQVALKSLTGLDTKEVEEE